MPYRDPVFSNITWALGANYLNNAENNRYLQSCDERCQEIGGTCEEFDINTNSDPWRKKYLLDIYKGLLNDTDEINHATGTYDSSVGTNWRNDNTYWPDHPANSRNWGPTTDPNQHLKASVDHSSFAPYIKRTSNNDYDIYSEDDTSMGACDNSGPSPYDYKRICKCNTGERNIDELSSK